MKAFAPIIAFLVLIIFAVLILTLKVQYKKMILYGLCGFIFFSVIVSGILLRIYQLAFNSNLPLITMLIIGIPGAIFSIYLATPKGQELIKSLSFKRTTLIIFTASVLTLIVLNLIRPEYNDKVNECLRHTVWVRHSFNTIGCYFQGLF